MSVRHSKSIHFVLYLAPEGDRDEDELPWPIAIYAERYSDSIDVLSDREWLEEMFSLGLISVWSEEEIKNKDSGYWLVTGRIQSWDEHIVDGEDSDSEFLVDEIHFLGNNDEGSFIFRLADLFSFTEFVNAFDSWKPTSKSFLEFICSLRSDPKENLERPINFRESLTVV